MGREAECMGKCRYETKGKAIERINKQAKDRRRLRSKRGKHITMEAYRCPYCHYWHVGSTFDRKWLRARQRDEERLARAERMVGIYVGR